jgi:hypothetical protein
LRKFDSIRSSVNTNYSLNNSVKTFNEESRVTSDFGDLIENNNKIVNNFGRGSNSKGTFCQESNSSSLSNNSLRSSGITKISNISKYSESSSDLKNPQILPRGSMGIFNKKTRELVGAEENLDDKELFNTIEKSDFQIKLICNKSLTIEKKPLENNFISIKDRRKSFIITEVKSQIISDLESITIPKILKNEKYTYRGYTDNLNKRQGFGICLYLNGDKYTGNWLDDKKEGWGRYEFLSSGKIFQGEFKNNQIDGYVEFINRNGIIHQGYMKNQKFLNNEVMTIIHPKYELNGVMEYNANISKLTGVGSIKYKNGISYEGETLESYEHGWGITKNLDNTIVQGLKEENTYNSYCEIFYPNKDKFFGWFKKNKKNGKGVLINSDGTYTLGNYIQDLKDGGFIHLAKGEAKFELHLFGFHTKTVEKKENIISYLNLVYPEYKWLIKANNKILYEKLANS